MGSKDKLTPKKSFSKLKIKAISNDMLENISGGMDISVATENFKKLKNNNVIGPSK